VKECLEVRLNVGTDEDDELDVNVVVGVIRLVVLPIIAELRLLETVGVAVGTEERVWARVEDWVEEEVSRTGDTDGLVELEGERVLDGEMEGEGEK